MKKIFLPKDIINKPELRVFIDGFQTMQRLKAEVEGDENSVKFIFSKYLPDNIFEPYKPGEILLRFEREESELNTFWGKINPMDKRNSESGKVYFNFLD